MNAIKRRWLRPGTGCPRVVAAALGLVLVAAGSGWERTARGANPDRSVLPASLDATLFEQSPDHNLGASDSLAVGGTAHGQEARALIGFSAGRRAELAGARVTAATLAFSVTRQPAGGVDSMFRVHRLLTRWSEGRGDGNTGSPAQRGEPTWNSRAHPDTGWGSPGGKAGVDYVEEPSGAVRVAGLGRYTIRSEGLAADVRHWIANPDTEFGWILISESEGTAGTARRVGSRESMEAGPVLTLEHVPGSAAPRIDRVERKGEFLEFEFRAEAGNVYEVQHRVVASTPGDWLVASTHVAKLVSTNVVVRAALADAPARWFRVVDVADVD